MADTTNSTGSGVHNANTLIVNMGPNAAQRVSNEDPLNLASSGENFVLTGSGGTVTIEYTNGLGGAAYGANGSTFSQTFTGVGAVVVDMGTGTESLVATGLSGVPIYVNDDTSGNYTGNYTIELGTLPTSTKSVVVGGSGSDTISVLGGNVEIDTGDGSNTVTVGSSAAGTYTIKLGPGSNTILSGSGVGSSTVNHVVLGDNLGVDDLTGLSASAGQNILDFTQVGLPLTGAMSGTGSTIFTGSSNIATFDLQAITEIIGGEVGNAYTFTNPVTEASANSGEGLIVAGGVGNDTFTFNLDNSSQIGAAGITLEGSVPITSAATLGTVLLGKVGNIKTIPLSTAGSGYTVAPDVTITDSYGTGYGAYAVAGLNSDGTVSGIYVVNSGKDYTDPVVTLTPQTSFSNTVIFNLKSSVAPYTIDQSGNSNTAYSVQLKNTAGTANSGGPIKITKDSSGAATINNVTFNTIGSVVSQNSAILLNGNLAMSVARLNQGGAITANSVSITSKKGFLVDDPINAMNNGNVSIVVTDTDTTAKATATIVNGSITAVTLTSPGSQYTFAPVVAIEGGGGSGAIVTATVNATTGQVTGFTVVNGGSGYNTYPAPLVLVADPDSIQVDNFISSSNYKSAAGTGDGRGTITLTATHGSIDTLGAVVFPDTEIAWNNGNFVYEGNDTLDSITPAAYPGTEGGSGATATAVVDDNGRVVAIEVDDGGTGYNSSYLPSIVIGGTAEATPLINNGTGAITGFAITNPGGGYVSPTVTITAASGDTTGTDGSAAAIVNSSGQVTGFVITDPGTHYTIAPVVAITGGGASAEATATTTLYTSGAKAGEIQSINLVTPGTGYAQPPSVQIISNGFGKLSAGTGGINQKFIASLNGTLVLDAADGVGTPENPLKTQVGSIVGLTTAIPNALTHLNGAGVPIDPSIYILQNGSVDVGIKEGINGLTVHDSNIYLVTFNGTISLGVPVQRTDDAGNPLFQDAAKTIPIYETDPSGNIVFQGGQIKATGGDITFTADNILVNTEVASSGGDQLTIEPTNPLAPIGLTGTQATASATISSGSVQSITLTNAGASYTSTPLVTMTAPGNQAFATAAASAGQVTAVDLTYGGTNYSYSSPPTITVVPLDGLGSGAAVTAIMGVGPATVVNGGSGYTSAPTVSITGGGGSGATGTATISGVLAGLTVSAGGTGYTSSPLVSFTGGGGSGATATAILANGSVTGLTITDPGTGYTIAPTVVFTPANGHGSGATATATVTKAVIGVTITSAGTGYTSAPTISFSGGGGSGAIATSNRAAVAGFTVTAGGHGYSQPPTIVIAAPGQQATAVATVSNGSVTGLTIINAGSNYVLPPTITIAQPYAFGLTQTELNYFQQGFTTVVVGRTDGNGVVNLNAGAGGATTFNTSVVFHGQSFHFNNLVDTAGGITIDSSTGDTTYFSNNIGYSTGSTTADYVTINDSVVLDNGTNYTVNATDAAGSGISIQNPGSIDGTVGTPDYAENLTLNSAASVSIGGTIGLNPTHGSVPLNSLTVDALGNVTFGSNVKIGSGGMYVDTGLGNVVVTNNPDGVSTTAGGAITFSGDVTVTGDLVIGDPNNLNAVSSVTFTSSSHLNVTGKIKIYTSGTVSFGSQVGNITAAQAMVIQSEGSVGFASSVNLGIDPLTILGATNVSFSGQVNAGDFYGTNITGTASFSQAVTVNSLDLTADNAAQFVTLGVGPGNAVITSDQIGFNGGGDSVNPTSGTPALTLKPYTLSRNVGVGSPSGSSATRLDISDTDLNAIGSGFSQVVIGDVNAGTGTVTLGTIGNTNNGGSQIVNPMVIAGGTVTVAGGSLGTVGVDLDSGTAPADYLYLIARTGDLTVNAPIDADSGEQAGWIHLQAGGNIIINKPVYATDRITLVAGTAGTGNVTINGTGSTSGGLLQTVSGVDGSDVDQRIEITAGTTSGNITITDTTGHATILAGTVATSGTVSQVVLDASAGTITQTGGQIDATNLAVWTSGIANLLTTVNDVTSETLNGVLFSSGSGATATATMVLSGLTLTNPGSGFTSVPTISIIGGGGSGASGTATINGSVASLTVTDSGSGYLSAPSVGFSGGGGSGAAATAIVSGGVVTGFTITNGGTGYTSNPTVALTGGAGSGAAATATINDSVTGVALTNAGSGYTSIPTVTLTGGGGSGASAVATLSGAIGGVTVSGGSGYQVAPTVSLVGGGGTYTSATATIAGPVSGYTVTSGGSGYSTAPSVVLTGGGYAVLATATASIAGPVSSITVTGAGSNYTSTPTVTVSAPGGSGTTATAFATITGVVSSFSLTAVGSGYTSAPTVILTSADGVGSGAAATATIAGGAVTGITLSNSGGTNYDEAPIVTLTGGGGTGATATAVMHATVARITVTSGGSGYASAPTVSITGGGGAGATATSTIDGKVTGIAVSTGGSGYASAPAVSFTGGGGSGATAIAAINGVVTAVGVVGSSGYTNSPTVVFSGGHDNLVVNGVEIGGSGALTVAQSTNITLTNVTTEAAGFTPGAFSLTTAATSAGNIVVDYINTISGAVNLTADGAITSGASGPNLVTSGEATLIAKAGIGTGSTPLLTHLGTVEATNSATGGIFLQETDTLAIGGTGLQTQAGNGSIVVVVTNGTLTVNSAVSANGSGNILLKASGSSVAASDADINAAVGSGTGNISVWANQSVNLAGTGNIMVSAGSGTVDLAASVGSIEQASGLTVQTNGANISLNAARDVSIGLLDARLNTDRSGSTLTNQATWGSVAVTGFDIVDSNASSSGAVNIYGNGAVLKASGDIGQLGASVSNALQTELITVAADPAPTYDGAINLVDKTALTVGSVGPVTVQRVGTDGATLTPTSSTSLSGLATTVNGSIVVRTLAGDLTVNSTVLASGSGNVLVQAAGTGTNVLVNALIESGTGDVTVLGAANVTFEASTVLTAGTGSNGTVDIEAGTGSVTMDNDTLVTTVLSGVTGGNVRVVAGTNIVTGGITAGTAGGVSLAAGGTITNAGSHYTYMCPPRPCGSMRGPGSGRALLRC